MPLLEKEIYSLYGSKEFKILSICLDASEERFLRTVIPLNLSYHIMADQGGAAARAYDVRPEDCPLNLILDKKGIIRYREIGHDPDAMRRLIEELL